MKEPRASEEELFGRRMRANFYLIQATMDSISSRHERRIQKDSYDLEHLEVIPRYTWGELNRLLKFHKE